MKWHLSNQGIGEMAVVIRVWGRWQYSNQAMGEKAVVIRV